MPLYEYECEANKHRFEVIQKFSDPPIDICPTCGSKVEKLPSSPAIQFKGSGFYITDYARSGKGESGKSESGESSSSKAESSSSDKGGTSDAKGDGKSESRSETKPESKSETKAESKTESKSKSDSKPPSPATS
jgi:putative FmdB family regulatory protein